MQEPDVVSGYVLDRFPYVRVGAGPRKLVVFPAINDSIQDVTANRKYAAWFCRNLARGREVWLISRPRRLQERMTLREMAAEYARIFDAEIGQADVLGISMGGAIAQEFAVDHPKYVRRLLIGMAPSRLEPGTREVCRHWLELAEARDWRALYEDLIGRIYGPVRGAFFRAMTGNIENLLVTTPMAQSDFVVSVKACLEYDTADRLGQIKAPTLVLGGTDDQLVSVGALRALAQRVRTAALKLFEGGSHAVLEECKEEFDQTVASFLEDQPPARDERLQA